MTPEELAIVLSEGEGYRIEFKAQISNLDKEMVAFANASGGFICPGITEDRTVKGFRADNRNRSQIQDIAKPYRGASGFYNRDEIVEFVKTESYPARRYYKNRSESPKQKYIAQKKEDNCHDR